MLESNVVSLRGSVQLTCDIVRGEFEEINALRVSESYANSCVETAKIFVEEGELKDNVHLRCFFLGKFSAYVLLNTGQGVREIIGNIFGAGDES